MTDVAVDLPTRIMHRTVEEILNPGQRLAANPAKGHRVNIAGISAFLVGSERSSKTIPKAPFPFLFFRYLQIAAYVSDLGHPVVSSDQVHIGRSQPKVNTNRVWKIVERRQ